MDINVSITLKCDEYMTKLVAAVLDTLDKIDGAQQPMASVPKTQPAAPVKPAAPAVQSVPAQPAAQTAPAPAVPTAQPAPAINSTPVAPALFNTPDVPKAAQPAPAPAPAVPTAPPKTYTLEDLLTAAGPLMDQGMYTQLAAITTKYGVKSFTELQPAQFGAVAADLRALGAKL